MYWTAIARSSAGKSGRFLSTIVKPFRIEQNAVVWIAERQFVGVR